MKALRLTHFACSIVLLALTPLASGERYSGGTGIGKMPYLIGTVYDWQELIGTPTDWDKGFELIADIDFEGQSILPVAPDTGAAYGFQGTKFTGTLDGKGFTLKNAVINQPTKDYVGLFGFLGTGAQILNLRIKNFTVSGLSPVGLLAGENAGSITRCQVLGSVFGNGDYTGGLVGYNSGTIRFCCAQSRVLGTGYHRGGLIGHAAGTISNSYAVGTVSGTTGDVIGGLAGTLDGGTITNCYSSCRMNAAGYSVGGMIGDKVGGTVTGSYWDTELSGKSASAGGTGKTTAQMKQQATFVGWDFSGGTAGWQITENQSCPRIVSLLPAYSGGNGTSGTPYLISNASDWLEMIHTASDYSNTFRLTEDIDFGGQTLTPVAPDMQAKFTGYFNGQHKFIRNIVISQPTQDYAGLFGWIGASGSVQRLNIRNIRVSGQQYVGGLAAYNQGQIHECSITGTVQGTHFYIGGLVGWQENIVYKCFAQVEVAGDIGYYVGGLVGANASGTILQSCARGSVSSNSQYVGGLVGINGGVSSSIENCYATGNVTADYNSGGLVALNVCAISYCYSTGYVSGGTSTDGGLVGTQNSPGTTIRSYWDKQTSGKTTSAAGVGKTTDQMYQQASFVLWDWTSTWTLDRRNYPQLRWSVDMLNPDLNNSGVVGFNDLALFVEQWLSGGCVYPDWCGGADLNAGGRVELNDFAILSEAWLDVASTLPTMVLIPGGTFEMGDSFFDGDTDEWPVHSVTLSPFYMSKYHVTNQQYCDFLNSALGQGLIAVIWDRVYQAGSGLSYPYCDSYQSSTYSQIDWNGSGFSVRTKGGRSMGNDPMVRVSWYGAAAYCNWKSRQEDRPVCYNLSTWECDFSKKGYRLPTEAQWEYAARGGLSGRRFPWGETITHSQANYYSYSSDSYDNSATQGIHPLWDDGVNPYISPVGSFPANGYGLFDMAGNVFDWCHDWYDFTYYSNSPSSNPTGPATGTDRVLRGGGWSTGAFCCRVACRYYRRNPSNCNSNQGFRLSMDF